MYTYIACILSTFQRRSICQIAQISSQNNFQYFSLICIIHTDYCHYFPSVLETGHQRDYRSNLLYINRHTDAAVSWKTNVRKFQVHSGKKVIRYFSISEILRFFSIILRSFRRKATRVFVYLMKFFKGYDSLSYAPGRISLKIAYAAPEIRN